MRQISGSFASCFGLAIGLLLALASGLSAQQTAGSDEEFSGPFPSWRNVRTYYGAVGDGKADDTAALQRALDDLTAHKDFCVVYFPAGVYRLTATLHTDRKNHTDCQGVAVLGESPENTVLLWDGPAHKPMFRYDAWYSRISRLAFDGAGRAEAALSYGPAFSTHNETSDLILRDAGVGIQFGGNHAQGQAENEVLRCNFLRCTDAGVVTGGFNCMDIWVWYSRFEDCGHALFNAAGNFHAWQNLFLRSRVADIGTANLMVFSFVNNTSIGSKRFLDFEGGHTWGSPTTISGNRILEPVENFPLRLGNGGPYLVMDNIFKLPANSHNQAAKMTWGDQTFLGNTYSCSNAVKEQGRFRRLAEKEASQIMDVKPLEMPPAPTWAKRRIFEVPPGADARAIQQAIDAASAAGARAIVHLPMGVYNVNKTLVIPPESDAQIIGDSDGETGTRLNWTGPAGGLFVKIRGPTRATLRDMCLDAGKTPALLVTDTDQPGGKIFTDQLLITGPVGTNPAAAALRVDGLQQTDVLLRCLQGGGNAGNWVQVLGPANAPAPPANQISIFNGATGSSVGQYSVRRGGRLVVRGVYHEKDNDTLRGIYLDDSGTLTIDATRFSYATSARAPLIQTENFKGSLTLATCQLQPVDSSNACRFLFTGDGSGSDVLALNDLFWVEETGVTAEKVWLNRATPPARGGLAGCNLNSDVDIGPGGFAYLQNLGDQPDPGEPGASRLVPKSDSTVPDEALLRHLAPLREARVWLPGARPAHATDLRIHRVMVIGGRDAVIEFRAGEDEGKN